MRHGERREREVPPGEDRRRRAIQDLGLEFGQAHALHDALLASLSVEVGGFRQFEGADALLLRAVASDLVLTAADALDANLIEAALHAQAYADFVGPNGRAMPGPQSTVADEVRSLRAEADLVGFFRALGSVLDCLSATLVGVLRLPQAIHRTDASLIAGGFDRLLEKGFRAPSDQLACCHEMTELLRSQREQAPGWLEWLVEMRNRVVHRGRQLNTWMPVPRPASERRLLIRTAEDPVHLVRFEPHLRRRPWLDEMNTLRRGGDAGEQWLTEPAPATMSQLLRTTNEMSEAICERLTAAWSLPLEQTAAWPFPDRAWATDGSGPPWRRELAEEFMGFDASYPIPDVDQIRTSARDALRLQIAERLRTGDE